MPPMPPMGPGGRKPGGPHGARLTMEKPKDAKNTLKKLIGYIGRNRYLFFALIGVMLIITLLNLAAPSIQQIAIDCITLTKKKTSVDFGALGKTLIGLGAVYLLSSVFTYMQGIFSAKLSQYTVKTMRKDLFSSLVRLPIKYLDTHSHGDIMSRMTNDVENISTTISQSIGSLISGVLTIVGTVVIMLLYSPLLTLISLSTVFLTIFVSGVLTKYMKKYFIKQQVLKDLDLEVKAGQKIAIVGATGSGKTTIVNLLTRFYPVDSGEITIDSQSIYDIPKDKLRRSIAIVLQDTVLFKDTIEENIRYGRENATLDEIKAAAKFANADEFIERLSEGYDTVLAEGGSNLSQGQRQLLSIARAVLADPKILILDEATSSVDTRTEMHIQSTMVALMKNRTSLIIAHRLSTIRDADKIVVIDGGRVAEQGSHEELIAAKGCYYRLYQTQFSGVKT